VILESKEESMDASCTCILAMEKGWGIFNVYSSFQIFKNLELASIDYLEIENLERSKFDLGATI